MFGPRTVSTRPETCCVKISMDTIDPREKFNVAAKNPDVVRELTELTAKHKASFQPGPTQLEATVAP